MTQSPSTHPFTHSLCYSLHYWFTRWAGLRGSRMNLGHIELAGVSKINNLLESYDGYSMLLLTQTIALISDLRESSPHWREFSSYPRHFSSMRRSSYSEKFPITHSATLWADFLFGLPMPILKRLNWLCPSLLSIDFSPLCPFRLKPGPWYLNLPSLSSISSWTT